MFSNIQEQEHWEHEAGRYSNEFEAAYDLSRIEYRRHDAAAEVRRLTALGFYVVVSIIEDCCPFTDALLGHSTYVSRVTTTYEAAREYAGYDEDGEWCGYSIEMPEQQEEVYV